MTHKTNKKILARFAGCERGSTAIEYGLIAALIASVVVGAMTTLGSNLVSNYYNDIGAIF